MARRTPLEHVVDGDIVIRRHTADDAVALHEAILQSVDHLAPWMPWVAMEPLTVDDREQLIARWSDSWDDGEEFSYGVFADETLIGGCGLHRRSNPDALEIGYWTAAGAINRGVATSAARALVRAAFEPQVVDVLEIHHDVANARSGRIPRRLGFQLVDERPDEVAAPGEVGVERVWRLHRTDWARAI